MYLLPKPKTIKEQDGQMRINSGILMRVVQRFIRVKYF